MWIESHQSLGRHPKTKRLARKLGVSIPCTIGHLHLLWWWALDYAQDGDLSNFEPLEIADEMMWTGDPDDLIAALKDAKFLDFEPTKLTIHDWDDYAGKLLEQRARHAEVMRQQRIKRKEVTLPSRDSHESVTVLATVPNLTVPNLTNQKNEISHEISAALPRSPALTYQGFIARLKDETNKPAVVAEAISAWYAVDCQEFGRIGTLGKAHGLGEILKMAWTLLAQWNEVDNPLDYIQATAAAKKSDRRNGHNGNGHSVEKLPTNHQPADLPEVIDHSQSLAEQHAELDALAPSPALKEFREWRERGRVVRPASSAIVALGTAPAELGG